MPTYRITFLCLLSVLASSVQAAEVWVITDSHHPMKNATNFRLIELDAPVRIEAELSAQLPSDQAQATAMVRQRLNAGGLSLQKRMATAYQGVTDAWSLGVSKVPAVVVDQRYVIYGEQDVAQALALIKQYRRMQQ
ncbi:TIGR03757 family integrating conjugative element protein [Serratia fonticola]|uniref:TIGR03757 family integrating conjugative element protein n=1 Tax=Serratia fonticola TaxID=47917 RepID=UPI00192AD3AA|nr:TIGR03757 family integrating conjugative element protein [Serratia fonticola]MBL5862132.1 TIGR03757 family integrating conjugative element protein [Serratia fonticola]